MGYNYTIDEELQTLRENVERKQRLERELDNMLLRDKALTDRLELLKKIKYDEQRDVDRIEGNHLARLWYYITKQTDDRLSREREQALAAAAKYEAVKAESVALTDRIFKAREELARLGSCERRYDEKLKEKQNLIREALKDKDIAISDEIQNLESAVNENKRKLKELEEAVSVGYSAKSTASRILEKLDKADLYSAWDMHGGGIIANINKHDLLDDAQNLIESLQCQLSRFSTELVDVDISTDIRLDINASLKFADFFFDSLIADIMVANRIKNAIDRVNSTLYAVSKTIDLLEGMRKPIADSYERDKAELERLVNEIKL